MFARGLAEGEERNCLTGKRFSVGVTEITENQTEVVIAQYCKYTECHCIVPFRMVNLMLCEFYLNKSF